MAIPDRASSRDFRYDERNFLLDGKPVRLFSGELHYFRVPREYWRDRLQKMRSMGLNTVSSYMPWNLHEPDPGVYNFSEMLDAAAFFRLAQEEGLLAILRPGPYICAEWDFGGLPWWLLKDGDVRVRCWDPDYLQAAQRWIRIVGSKLSALTCDRGGPIVMAQVENEYGAFGNDREYVGALRQTLLSSGFDGIPLFTCDWATSHHMRAGSVEGCLAVANFGGHARDQIAALRRLRPGQPAMCGEFWCGWFDSWGRPRNGTDDPSQAVADLQELMDSEASFNLYMFHGGTNFGFTAGANANQGYEPDVTSYDYHAPLDESGRTTPKYQAFRSLLAGYQPAGASLPDVPDTPDPISIGPVQFRESAALLEMLPSPVRRAHPVPMERLGQSQGLVLYRTRIDGLGSHELRIVDLHDYAVVSLNGKVAAILDRVKGQNSVHVKDVPDDDAVLEILVDCTGRVNFGPRIHDRKGITERVEYGGLTLMEWEIFSVPLDERRLASLQFGTDEPQGPAFHRGTFEIETVGDTFLDMREWERGAVWVNGRNLGRFWSIGPQQTLYLPGVWLKPGTNEIVVFDLFSSGRQRVSGLTAPILNECRGAGPG